MDRDDFMIFVGRIAAQSSEGEEFAFKVKQMMNLLDDGDMEDFYGTQGWQYLVGWDD